MGLGLAPAFAQTPPTPYVYLVGLDQSRDLASPSKNFVGDGFPDTWLRLYIRNLDFYLKTNPGPIRLRALVLRTKGVPFRQWDTLPGSHWPLLQVIEGGRRINRLDGAIDGYLPPPNTTIDLYIADDGLVAGRHLPMELTVITAEGELPLTVSLANFYDQQRGWK